MYRVSRVLNNNGVIAIDMDDNQEYVLLGKGLGFGKKVSERFEKPEGASMYRLADDTERGSAKSLARNVPPEFIEMADAVMREAESRFGTVDRRDMLPLADHLSFAASRVRNGEQISNPLTDDIRTLFHSEFKTALLIKDLFRDRLGLSLDDHEVGYVALHVHSAIEDEKISMAMQAAQAVRRHAGAGNRRAHRRTLPCLQSSHESYQIHGRPGCHRRRSEGEYERLYVC